MIPDSPLTPPVFSFILLIMNEKRVEFTLRLPPAVNDMVVALALEAGRRESRLVSKNETIERIIIAAYSGEGDSDDGKV